jgi:4-amino-4-deoxy-L-arabinose transferase-like glycosyltransferase
MTVLPVPLRSSSHARFSFLPGWSGPRWVLWSLFGLLVLSAALYSWNIDSSGFSDYYAAAAKSMSVSWKAFFFGAFDPQSSITLDKLSGFLIPQALSARIFGFSAWSLAIPQVIEGLVTICATYYIVSRWIGAPGGLIAAIFIAFTPLLVSTFSHAMEDAMLTMCTTLAVAAWQRCIDTDRPRYLLLAGALVGLGFQAKMMQAWLVLPAMALVYLLVVARPLGQKLRRLLAAGTLTFVVSFAWISVIALIPASQRPYIDGTTNNNIFSMVLGYNGVNRFISNFFPGALGSAHHPFGNGTASGVGLFSGPLGHSPLKFFLPQYSSQIGWLYPLATAGVVLGFLALRRTASGESAHSGLRTGVLLSTALLVTVGTVMSVMSLPHTAYLASLAFPLAALSAMGVVLLWRGTIRHTSLLRFALPVTISVQTAWTLCLIGNYPQFGLWLMVPVGILGFAAALVLGAHALGSRHNRRLARIAAGAALAGAMLSPFVWSMSTLDRAYAGTADDAYAGPAAGVPANLAALGDGRYGIGLDSNRVILPTAAVEARIYDYATAHSPDQKYALASDSWRSAAPIIMRGGWRVLPIGGFTSRVMAPSVSELKQLVTARELKFILLTGSGSKNDASDASPSDLQQWVLSSCRLVPEKNYIPEARTALAGNSAFDHLYACGR